MSGVAVMNVQVHNGTLPFCIKKGKDMKWLTTAACAEVVLGHLFYIY